MSSSITQHDRKAKLLASLKSSNRKCCASKGCGFCSCCYGECQYDEESCGDFIERQITRIENGFYPAKLEVVQKVLVQLKTQYQNTPGIYNITIYDHWDGFGVKGYRIHFQIDGDLYGGFGYDKPSLPSVPFVDQDTIYLSGRPLTYAAGDHYFPITVEGVGLDDEFNVHL